MPKHIIGSGDPGMIAMEKIHFSPNYHSFFEKLKNAQSVLARNNVRSIVMDNQKITFNTGYGDECRKHVIHASIYYIPSKKGQRLPSMALNVGEFSKWLEARTTELCLCKLNLKTLGEMHTASVRCDASGEDVVFTDDRPTIGSRPRSIYARLVGTGRGSIKYRLIIREFSECKTISSIYMDFSNHDVLKILQQINEVTRPLFEREEEIKDWFLSAPSDKFEIDPDDYDAFHDILKM